MAVPYHTHSFEIPSATRSEVEAGVRDDVAATPASLGSAASKDISYFATSGQGGAADTAVQTVNGKSGKNITLSKSDIGLSNADNTSDANKPVSSATQAALDLKLNESAVGTAAYSDASDFATAAQGLLANTAVQKTTVVSAGVGLAGGGMLAENITLALSSTSLESLALADSAVQPARKLSAGTGLSGGGDFSADRVLALNAASIASLAKADSAVQPADIANFATKTELSNGLSGKLDVGAQAADSAKLQGYTPATLPISTATQTALNGKATSDQGAKADSAIQPSDLGALADKDKISVGDIDATGTPSAAVYLRGDGKWEAVAGAGTVTSVGVSVPTGFAVSGSPITSAGTITITYASGYTGYTTAEKTKLAGIAAGAQVNVPQVQPDWSATTGLASIQNKPTLGTASAQNVEAFATAGQGTNADNAVRFNAQTLTVPQQAQARGNISAASTADLTAFGEAVELALGEKLDKTGIAADSEMLGGKTEAQLPFLGVGQAWVDVTEARVNDTVYVNNTGKPIAVSVTCGIVGTASKTTAEILVDGVRRSMTETQTLGGNRTISAFAIVPNGSSYSVNANLTRTIMELR